MLFPGSKNESPKTKSAAAACFWDSIDRDARRKKMKKKQSKNGGAIRNKGGLMEEIVYI